MSSHARKLLPSEVLTHPSIAALVAGAVPTGTVSPEDVRRASDEAGVEPRHLKALLVHLSGLGISVQIDASGMRAVAATSKRTATSSAAKKAPAKKAPAKKAAASAEAQPVSLDLPTPDAASEPVKLTRPPEPATGPGVSALPDAAGPADASSQGAAPEPAPLPGEPAAIDKPTPSQVSRVSIEATAQIAAQILRKLEGRSTTFEMALTPDELGRVDVKLDIDADGRLTARLAFDNPLAATDLRGRADELRRQLEQAGFQLADNALEFAERDSSSNAFDRGSDSRDQGRAFANASRVNAEADAVAQPPRWVSLSLSPSGVDLKV